MTRVGTGFDVHAFDESRPLVLGGVTIPDHPGLAGHSDADVLAHAIGDALLGAAGMGDLGVMFPSTEKWRGASSIVLLGEVTARLSADGWSVVNVDATVVAETPRLSGYVGSMVERIAEALDTAPELISVKATSSDGLGFTGRREGIAALAVALIENVG